MRIITMQRLTLDGEPAIYNTANENGEDHRDWWCVIETKEEEMVYNKAFNEDYNKNSARQGLAKDLYTELWNGMVKHAGENVGLGLKWGDDDVYGYISPNEKVPEVRENFKDGDGDIWVRVD